MVDTKQLDGAEQATPEEIEAFVNKRFAGLYEVIGRKEEHIHALQGGMAALRKKLDELDKAGKATENKLRESGQSILNLQAAHGKEKHEVMRRIDALKADIDAKDGEIASLRESLSPTPEPPSDQ